MAKPSADYSSVTVKNISEMRKELNIYASNYERERLLASELIKEWGYFTRLFQAEFEKKN